MKPKENPMSSNHFRREAKLMLWLGVAPLLLAIVAACVVPRVFAFFAANACPDSGARFNQEANACEHE